MSPITGEKRKLVDIEELNVKRENDIEVKNEAITSKKKKKKQNKKLNDTEELDGKTENEVEVKNEAPSPKKKKKKKKKKKNKKKPTEAVKTEAVLPTENGCTEMLGDEGEGKDPMHDKASEAEEIDTQKSKKKKKKKKKNKSTVAVGGSNLLTCSLADCQPFSSLKELISKETMMAINEMGFSKMTAIQSKAIPPLLKGKDVRGTAKTGSGKTLAFIIPTVERLANLKFTPEMGTGAIIISPTRELSMQTFDVLNRVLKHHSLTSGSIMGGVDQENEANLLVKGVNIVVATPGRLLHHLQNTANFNIKTLECLVIDEADRILDVGFEMEVNKIIKLLPKKKQTMFFSATKDEKVNLLARLSLTGEPLEVEDESTPETATVEGLVQTYVVCHTEKKFLILHNFLEKNKRKKIMIFFTTCNAVKFYHGLLTTVGIKVLHIHGKQLQEKRTATFYEFCKAESSILLCTDVAARGWDIPSVDWIVQYDPPEEPKEYIHRVGRTARAGGDGKALLFVCEDEPGILNYLRKSNVPIKREDFTWNKFTDLQLKVEKIVKNNHGLKVLATVALMSYIRAYLNSQTEYRSKTFDVKKIGRSLGFENLPVFPKRLQAELEKIMPEARKKKRSKKKLSGANSLSLFSTKPLNVKGQFKMRDISQKSPFQVRNYLGKSSSKMGDKAKKRTFQMMTGLGTSSPVVKKFSKVKDVKGKHQFKENKVIKAKDKVNKSKGIRIKDKSKSNRNKAVKSSVG